MDSVSIENSIPYIVLFLLILFLYINEKNKYLFIQKKYEYLLLGVLFLSFFGLQCFVWNDWVNYYQFYNRLPNIFNLSITGIFYNDVDRFEIGFVIYSSIIKSMGVNYFGWVFINSFVDYVVLTYIFRKYSNSVALSYLSFIVFEGLSFEFNLFRSSKAMLLFLLSISSIYSKNYFRFSLLNLCAVLFHISSLVYIPLYFIIARKYNRLIILLLFVFSNFLYWYNDITVKIISLITPLVSDSSWLVSGKILGYLMNDYITPSFSVIYCIRLFIYLVLLLNYNKLFSSDLKNVVFINSFFIYVLLSNIFVSFGVFYVRVTSLFVYSIWLIIPLLFNVLYYGNNRVLNKIILLVLFLKLIGQTEPIYMKYKNVLWSDLNYSNNYQEWANNQYYYSLNN